MQTFIPAPRPPVVLKTPSRQLFLGAVVALFFVLTLALVAQEPSPAAPAASAVAADKTTPAAPPAEPAPAAAAVAPAPAPLPPLRRLDVTPAVEAAADDLKATVGDDEPAPAKATKRPRRTGAGNHAHGNDRVSVLGETHVLAEEKIDGGAIGVLGEVIVDGEVAGDAVSVLGETTINGSVNGNVVAVLGDVHLGPKAKITGDVVCVGGEVFRDPGATVTGKIIKKSVAGNKHFGPKFDRWWNESFKPARLLGFTPAFDWMWVVTLFLVAFYVVLALVFPGGIRKTGDMLVRRPVAVIISSILTMLALPVLFILLLITVVGIPVALLFLPLAVVCAILFGKAAIYALVGRGLTNGRMPEAVSMLAGAFLFVLLYLVPVAGLLLSLLVAFLGFGCVVTAIFTSEKKPARPAAPVPPAAPPVAPAAAAPAAPLFPGDTAATAPSAPAAAMAFAAPAADTVASGPTGEPPVVAAPAPATEPPRVYAVPPVMAAVPPLSAALPRAGFWIRLGALLIDLIVVGVIFGPMGAGAAIPLLLATYGALMWKFKGTTIGGIVCGLQVVRIDDRPIDWATAVVRALGCFVSLAVAGLGFVWVAFDDGKQSWHDKIAGTTVVIAPKGTSLV